MRRLRGSPGKGFCEVLAVLGRRRGMGQTRVGDRGGAVAPAVVSKGSGSNDEPRETGWRESSTASREPGSAFGDEIPGTALVEWQRGEYRFGSQEGLSLGSLVRTLFSGGLCGSRGHSDEPTDGGPGNETR